MLKENQENLENSSMVADIKVVLLPWSLPLSARHSKGCTAARIGCQGAACAGASHRQTRTACRVDLQIIVRIVYIAFVDF